MMSVRNIIGGLVFSVATCLVLVNGVSAVEEPSYWPKTGTYSISPNGSLSENPEQLCTKQTVKTWYFLNNPAYPATERETCVYETAYGSYASSGHIKRFIGGYVQLNMSLIPVPNTTKMYSRVCGYPCRLYTYDSGAGFTATSSNYGYRLEPKAGALPVKLPGQNLAMVVSAVGYSPNGRWLAIQTDGIFVRYDTVTGEFRKFSNPRGTYGVGRDPSFRFSITDDGRYIALTGSNYNQLVVFDMTKCTTVPIITIYDTTAVCESVEFAEKFRTTGYTVNAFQYISFRAGGRELLVQALDSANKPRDYAVRLNGLESRADYIALGDSFSSGEGDLRDNTRYLPGTDGTDEFPREKCHVSSRSYPYLLVNQKENLRFFNNFACSGAKTEAINANSSTYEGQFKQIPPTLLGSMQSSMRLYALQNDIRGRIPQYKFLEKYQPKNITVTIGGNDAGFGSVLASCVVAGSCEYESVERGAKALEMRSKYQVLRETYRKILSSSSGARLFVLSYLQFIDDENACNPNVGMNADERHFVRESVSYFNDVIRQAALAEGATFIDIEDSLKGQALCSRQLFDLAVNGVVAGDDKYSVIGQESFHPNAHGHELIANYIKNTYGSFPDLEGETCPTTSCSSYQAPVIPAYFNVLPSTVQRYKFALIDQAKDMYKRGSEVQLKFQNMLAGAVGRIFVHSTPRDLGPVLADSNGVFTKTVTLPVDLEPGYHELHVLTQALDGSTTSYYEPLFVIASEEDVDGDGTKNAEDACDFVEASGADLDKDGVDDACDGMIDRAPIATLISAETENLVSSRDNMTVPTSRATNDSEQSDSDQYTETVGGTTRSYVAGISDAKSDMAEQGIATEEQSANGHVPIGFVSLGIVAFIGVISLTIKWVITRN